METAKTSTGRFPLGLRQGGGAWQAAPVALVRWAANERFGCVDWLKTSAVVGLTASRAGGLAAGTVDLFERDDYDTVIALDSARQRDGIAQAKTHIDRCAAAGATVFFAVTIPADPTHTRRQNFDALVGSCAALAPALEETGTRLALEGWPGPGAVCCTPETFRALFAAVRSDRLGINYDPSHLVRMGIDPLRFAREFAGRIMHVHAKDAVISNEDMYVYGHELLPTFRLPRRWSGTAWRYTVAGRGGVPWSRIFGALHDAGYGGWVSVELEDEDFHGTMSAEQRGFVLAREFLESC